MTTSPSTPPADWLADLRQVVAGLDTLVATAHALQRRLPELRTASAGSLWAFLEAVGADEGHAAPVAVASERWAAGAQARLQEVQALMPHLLGAVRGELATRPQECGELMPTGEMASAIGMFRKGGEGPVYARAYFDKLPNGHRLKQLIGHGQCPVDGDGPFILLGLANSVDALGRSQPRAYYATQAALALTKAHKATQDEQRRQAEERNAFEAARRRPEPSATDRLAAEMAAMRKELAELRAAKAAPAAT